MKLKLCPGCNEEKPLSHFNGSRKNPDGLATRCAPCVNRRRRELAREARARAHGKPKAPLTAKAAAAKGDIAALRTALVHSEPTDPTMLLSVTVGNARQSKAKQYAEIATFLIAAGADPGGGDARGTPMLCLAAGSGVNSLVVLLRDAGAPASFYAAAALGDVDAVQEELAARPEAANTPDESGITAILYCAQSKLGRLDEVVERRLVEVASLLLDNGADAEASPTFSMPPLAVAAGHTGNQPLVELLLERTPITPDEMTLRECLRTMRRQGDRYSRICDVLLEHGHYDLDGVLRSEAHHEDIQSTIWLLARGADPSPRASNGRTTLHLAADRNSGIRVVGLLLGHGADINARDDLGHTPLFYARQSEKHKIVEFLLSHGAEE